MESPCPNCTEEGGRIKMKRKKIVRWLALGIFVLLIGFTIASNLVYEALLPRVKTTEFIAGMSTEGEIEYWVPEECVFGTEDSQSIVLYRVGERSGLFSMEYYVEEIDGRILEEKDGQVKIQAPAMSMMETLVCYRDKPLTSGETVYWLNPPEE